MTPKLTGSVSSVCIICRIYVLLGVQLAATEAVLDKILDPDTAISILGTLPRASSSSKHGCDTRRDRLFNLLRTDKVNMGVDTTSSNNFPLCSNDVRV